MKVLALDFGAVKIGLAIGDTEIGVASARYFLENNSQVFSVIQKICAEDKVKKIIVGLPAGFTGSTEQTKAVISFSDKLNEKIDIELELFDERFTTTIAQKNLQATGKKTHKQKELVDSEAARIILQDYLDQKY